MTFQNYTLKNIRFRTSVFRNIFHSVALLNKFDSAWNFNWKIAMSFAFFPKCMFIGISLISAAYKSQKIMHAYGCFISDFMD